MKIFFFIIISFTILQGCGKKSDPKYTTNIEQNSSNI